MKRGDSGLLIVSVAALVLAVAALVLAVAAVGAYVGTSFFPHRTETCTVTEKYVAREGGGNEYRLITEECGTLRVGGWLTGGRFDTADVYADLQVGATYEMELRGTRFGLLSVFPAVGNYSEVPA